VVTITELSKILEVSQQSISKLKKNGLFNKCLTTDKKKLNLQEAIDTIIQNSKTQDGKMYENAIKIRMSWNRADADKTIINQKSLSELDTLLDDESLNQLSRVTIIQKFWSGKREELKYKEEKRELIQMSEAKGIFEKLLTPLNQSMDDLPFILKESFPNTPDDSIQWLMDYINNIKVEFQKIK